MSVRPSDDRRCRYCGERLEGPIVDDPRSQECPSCLAEAHEQGDDRG